MSGQNTPLHILVTNDDGIDAPGLRVLTEAAAALGSVTLVAPAAQCSAMSQSLHIYTDMRMERRDYPVPGVTAWALYGTPADCVKAALFSLFPEGKPDLVLSGINRGYNTGFDIAYSGTVGAALEALMDGVPAIAVSSDFTDCFDTTLVHLLPTLRRCLAEPAPYGEIWNLNFPGCSPEKCRGVLWDVPVADQGIFRDNYEINPQADGSILLSEQGILLPPEAVPEGTDCWGILHDYVTASRLHCMVLPGQSKE